MNLFIKILKEISNITIGGFLIFIILFNPYVRPKQELKTGIWSIEKREHRLLMGLTGHTFLELRDENNNVVYQMHGLPTDSTGAKLDVGNKDGYKLKVWEFDGDKYLTKENKLIGKTGVTLAYGNKDEMLQIWTKLRECSIEINKQDIDYPKFGFNVFRETRNSNSVTDSLIECANLENKTIGIITPGRNNILINNKES